ncbi:MAG: membrane dipeptidase [Candidatus Promineifilaceae bacterium]|nr:membrane dipeptidase [Candidatus Promineifilaceae bacterium]
MFFVDAHLDLAYNALYHGRDLTASVAEVRQSDAARKNRDPAAAKRRGVATTTFPALRDAGVGLVFGTLFVAPASHPDVTPGRPHSYRDADEAFRYAMAQLDYYHRLGDEQEQIRLVTDLTTLEEVVASHDEDGPSLLGVVPLMEGADPIREPAEAELWYERGLRLIGPAWDDTRYAPGAWRAGGRLTKDGHRLLEVMADLGFILDLTHMSEEASLEACQRYEGVLVATHSNARALVPGERQFSDSQIQAVAERDGVIGVVLYNKFLKAGYRQGDPRQTVTVADVVAHIDHICQLCGDAAHVGIGSDFDGGFGLADLPSGIDGHAYWPAVAQALAEYGYQPDHIDAIMGGNWLGVLRRALDG